MRCIPLLLAVLLLGACKPSPSSTLNNSQIDRASFESAGKEVYSTSEARTLGDVIALLARQDWQPYYVTTPSGFSGCWVLLHSGRTRVGTLSLYDRNPKLSVFLEIAGGIYHAELNETDTTLLKRDLMIVLPDNSATADLPR